MINADCGGKSEKYDCMKAATLLLIVCICLQFRIVGTQLVCPGDEGFQWFATAGKSSSAISHTAGTGGGVKVLEKDKGSTE